MSIRYYHRILESDLPAYLALGWVFVDESPFALNSVSVLVEWTRDDAPVLP